MGCLGLVTALTGLVLLLLLRHHFRDPHSEASSDDAVPRICQAAAWFKDNPPSFVLGTRDRIQAFEEACAEVFPTLEKQVQEHLWGLAKSRKLGWSLKNRWRAGIDGADDHQGQGLKFTDATKCSGGVRQKRPDELEEGQDAYMKAGVFPLKERWINVSEVPQTLAMARIAKFDARSVVPASLFNITVEDISQMHSYGGLNKEIPIFMHSGMKAHELCYQWIFDLTELVPQWGVRSFRAKVASALIIPGLLRFFCPKLAPSLAEVGARVKDFHKEEIPWSTVWAQPKEAYDVFWKYNKADQKVKQLCSGQLNLRRVPMLAPGLDMAKAVGLGSVVEATHNVLWLGHSMGALHDDFNDNIFVQLSGRASFLVFPPNCTWLLKPIYGPHRVIDENDGQLGWAIRGQPKGQVRAPFYHIVMKPGEGLVVPSSAVHRVVAGHSNRISLNAFFEPKFGRMQWPGAPSNAFNRQEANALAMRQLVIKSLKHLWDTQQVVHLMHTERLEFI